LKLNLGCRVDHKKGYINVDIEKRYMPNQIADLEKKFPWKTSSCDEILALHIVEHLVNHKLFLKECFRVLKKTGFMVLETPNYSSFGTRISHLFGHDLWLTDFNHVRLRIICG